MIDQVTLVFDSVLQQILAPKPEILRLIMNHERKPLAIKLTCEQIAKAESHSKVQKHFDAAKYRAIIFQCAKLFANFALSNMEQKALSELERKRLVDQHERMEKIAEEFAEMEKEVASGKLVSLPGQTAR